MENTENALERIISSFNLTEFTDKLIAVAITVFIFFIVWRILKRVLNHIFKQRFLHNSQQNEKRNLTLQRTFMSFLSWTTWILCLLVVLSYYIDIGAILAVAGVGTIAVGFAAQSIVEDVMSGLMIIVEDQFNIDDYVQIEDHYGVVERIGVRTTSIRQLDGGLYSIYNGQIKQVLNYSKGNIVAPAEFMIGVQEDIDQALMILKNGCDEIYENFPDIFPIEPVVIGVINMQPTSVTIKVNGYVQACDKAKASSILWSYLTERLDKNGIRMPHNNIQILDPNWTGRLATSVQTNQTQKKEA